MGMSVCWWLIIYCDHIIVCCNRIITDDHQEEGLIDENEVLLL